jgi:UMF1 family MFS transporter
MLFVLNIFMVTKPEAFGLAGAAAAVKASFVITAAWWLLFTLPALFVIKESPALPAAGGQGGLFQRAFSQLFTTFREIRGNKVVLTFLAAFVLYNDAVNTIIKMAVDYGKAIGLDNAGMFKALLITQFVGFPAAIVFGRLGEKIGPKRGILTGLAVYAGVCFWGWRMTTQNEFFAMACIIGLVQGGVQALSRSYFARMIPPERGGEYYGFYNMLGKFAAVIGPSLMGVTALLTDSRTSILSLLILIVGGGLLLTRVNPAQKT